MGTEAYVEDLLCQMERGACVAEVTQNSPAALAARGRGQSPLECLRAHLSEKRGTLMGIAVRNGAKLVEMPLSAVLLTACGELQLFEGEGGEPEVRAA